MTLEEAVAIYRKYVISPNSKPLTVYELGEMIKAEKSLRQQQHFEKANDLKKEINKNSENNFW